MMKQEYPRLFSLLGMNIELTSNYPEILEDDEYFLGKNGKLHSLLSNFYELVQLTADTGKRIDVRIKIEDNQQETLTISKQNGTYVFSGPVKALEEGSGDKRASIFGNMGIFSKILVLELEKRGIHSFHSTSFVQPGTNRLYLILGGSGAGKSTVLLKAVKEGMQIFGTELTHFSIKDDKVMFYKGSLWQNCRMGNLVEDFPSLLETFSIDYTPNGNPWKQYLSVDLKPWQYPEDVMEHPEVVILFPRIESDRLEAERYPLEKAGIIYSAYENLSDKVSPPSYVYKKVFIPSVDTGSDQIKRMEAAEEFLKYADIQACWKFLTCPEECLDVVLV
ncbi:MAG: hypothetical protein HQ557_04470 [Bacteroidetes bacterium]|nr:hypothetical protein [Bacteroidota bacterium]